MCAQLGGAVRDRPTTASSAAPSSMCRNDCALFRRRLGAGRARAGVDEPRRPRHAPAARLPRRRRPARARPSPPSPTMSAASTACMFHPEVVHTPHGAQLLRNFTHDVAGCAGDWTMAGFRDAEIARIRAAGGQGRVICGLSGGVDFSVAAVLIHEAIGDQLTCIFVDHGLLRAGEAEEVVNTFRDRFNIRLVHRDASDLFLGALDGVTDPEDQAQDHRPAVHRGVRGRGGEDRRRRFPGAGHAVSGRDRERQLHRRPERHHQVAPQCRRPARADAHAAGRAAARTVQGRGARAGPRARPARRASSAAIRSPARASPSAFPARSRARSSTCCAGPTRSILEEIRAAGLYDAIWQAFAVLLPVRTVGVMGDGRTYDMACALRAVTSTDGMTADVYPFEHGVPDARGRTASSTRCAASTG